tara:strand:+ start:190 stop:615 length:426 start_codon:yes stop_codon:yes gene_type:complete
MKTQEFEIVLEYIKDLSAETPDVQTLIFVRNNISKYQMNIDIKSKAVKNKMVEVTTKLTFEDKDKNKMKSFFELSYGTIIKLKEEINEKKKLEKILLCDLQKIVYPKIEKIFLEIIRNTGYPEIKFEKKVDFDKLYNQRFN